MTLTKEVELLHQMHDAVRRGDLEGFLALHDPDAKLIPLILGVEGGGYQGHEGVRRFWSEIHAAFPDWHWKIEGVRAVDQGALATVRICGHGTGSGVMIDERAWQVIRVRQGRIVWRRIFRTEAEALEAVSPAGQGSS